MNKFVTLKTNEESAYHSWAEQMLLDKINKYHLRHLIQTSYEVIKETEKAVCIKVLASDMFTESGNDYLGKDWDVWMPKSAINA